MSLFVLAAGDGKEQGGVARRFDPMQQSPLG